MLDHSPRRQGQGKKFGVAVCQSVFAIPFFKAVSRKEAKIAMEYVSVAEQVSEPFYNPETDCYIKNIGVAKASRGRGLLRAMLDEICGDMPICLETHDETNVAIYQKLGFILLATTNIHGINHYFMKRPAKSEDTEI